MVCFVKLYMWSIFWSFMMMLALRLLSFYYWLRLIKLLSFYEEVQVKLMLIHFVFCSLLCNVTTSERIWLSWKLLLLVCYRNMLVGNYHHIVICNVMCVVEVHLWSGQIFKCLKLTLARKERKISINKLLNR